MSHPQNKTTWLIQNFFLLLVGTTLVWLVTSGQIFWYVRPDYHSFTLVMGVIALFLGFFGFWMPEYHSHHEEKMSAWLTHATIFLTFLFCVYLIGFHRSSLSPRAATNRGLNQNAVTGTKNVFEASSGVSPLLEVGDSERYTLADWIRLFRINPDPWSHKGKRVKVVGFVQPLDGSGFYVSRFVISCCTVDASPIGVAVKSSETFEQGQWLEVTGVMDASEINGSLVPTILPDAIKTLEEPEQPYLY